MLTSKCLGEEKVNYRTIVVVVVFYFLEISFGRGMTNTTIDHRTSSGNALVTTYPNDASPPSHLRRGSSRSRGQGSPVEVIITSCGGLSERKLSPRNVTASFQVVTTQVRYR